MRGGLAAANTFGQQVTDSRCGTGCVVTDSPLEKRVNPAMMPTKMRHSDDVLSVWVIPDIFSESQNLFFTLQSAVIFVEISAKFTLKVG